MANQIIHIKNMCCQRCIEAVSDELSSIGLKINSVKLGIANYEPSDKITILQIENALIKRGFEMLKEEEEILFEKIKTVTLDLVNKLPEIEKSNFVFSSYLKEKIKIPYRILSKIFSSNHQFTIEKYFILLKIEKTKDLIENSNLQFSEIADLMGYKSHQHLSTQFKKQTGMSMRDYKISKSKNRIPIDTI